ncbi:MAG: hypothetical protein ACSNEK_05455 [Parachlamydiaceae bacterium]
MHPKPFLQRVLGSSADQRMLNANPEKYPFGKKGLELNVQIDRF